MKHIEDFTDQERITATEFIRYAVAEVLWNQEQTMVVEGFRNHFRSASDNDKCRMSNMAKAVLDNIPAILSGTWTSSICKEPITS